jgi:3-hydroxyacyl-[acyl-carrier-protein] dehydratase
MRWFLLDRFVKLERGKYAKAIKNITLGESHLHDHFPSFPVMPNTLIIESLAQTGGILVGFSNDYKVRVVLGKVLHATFYEMAICGDTLELEVRIDYMSEDGSKVNAWAHVGDKKVAEVELMYVHINDANVLNLPKENFIFNPRLMSLLRISEVFDGVQVSLNGKEGDE